MNRNARVNLIGDCSNSGYQGQSEIHVDARIIWYQTGLLLSKSLADLMIGVPLRST
jgi:hypothetical protein